MNIYIYIYIERERERERGIKSMGREVQSVDQGGAIWSTPKVKMARPEGTHV